MSQKLLTKTRFLAGVQCLRYLWVQFNEPERVPPPDASLQYQFDEGHAVDGLAKKLYPDGIDIPAEPFEENLAATEKLLKAGRPLFQPGAMAQDLCCRADILVPLDGGGWELIDVKKSTGVKPGHYDDLAFQKHCLTMAGISIKRCFIAHLNKPFLRTGEINPHELFVKSDITDFVNARQIGLEARLSRMREVISAPQAPAVVPGNHCDDPHRCPLKEECWSTLPEHSIFELNRGGAKCSEMYSRGVARIKDIPAGTRLTANQQIQKQCVTSGQAHVNRSEIGKFLARLCYPVSYLDFETINPAIPLYDGTGPYQRIPFQFSLDVVNYEGAAPAHHSFLADGPPDPRPGLLPALNRHLPESGSIVVYNQAFEGKVLEELGAAFPRYAGWVEGVLGRLVDLYVPFRSFHYYHPDQHGSASIKAVLPALTGQSYQDLPIGHGDEAMIAYWNITYKAASDAERKKVREDLERYCGLDTDGMRQIVETLGRV